MPIELEDPCDCGNADPVRFRQYRNSDNELIGKFCKECNMEWLAGEYLSASSTYSSDFGPIDTKLLDKKKPPELKEKRAFQIHSARTKIDFKNFADILKPADHITWHRKKGIWHHSIVAEIPPKSNEIPPKSNEIIVIHWTKNDHGDLKIIEEGLQVEREQGSLFNQMYRVDYPEEVTKANDKELVLARARSRIDDTRYGLFTDNCESFATYCKTGSEKSHQVAWLKGKIKEILGATSITVVKSVVKSGLRAASMAAPRAATEIIPAELIEVLVKGSQGVGAGIVIMLETGFVIWDLSEAYTERKDGKTSRDDFVEATTRRVVEGMASAGLAIGCSIGLEIGIGCLFGIPFGPAGILVGGIIGGLIGGIAGGAVGRVIGTWLGSLTGKAIARRFKDDRAIASIDDLQPGDHIVLNGWCLHPRCHAIVVEHNGVDKILVIRNTYGNGVVEELMQFSQPLFRVEYAKGTCLEPEMVIQNARSKIGAKKYSLAIYNCKTFARECKTMSAGSVIETGSNCYN